MRAHREWCNTHDSTYTYLDTGSWHSHLSYSSVENMLCSRYKEPQKVEIESMPTTIHKFHTKNRHQMTWTIQDVPPALLRLKHTGLLQQLFQQSTQNTFHTFSSWTRKKNLLWKCFFHSVVHLHNSHGPLATKTYWLSLVQIFYQRPSSGTLCEVWMWTRQWSGYSEVSEFSFHLTDKTAVLSFSFLHGQRKSGKNGQRQAIAQQITSSSDPLHIHVFLKQAVFWPGLCRCFARHLPWLWFEVLLLQCCDLLTELQKQIQDPKS